MKRNRVVRGLAIGLALFFLVSLSASPVSAAKKSSKKKKTTQRTSEKKKAAKKSTPKGVYYITPVEENLRVAPSGQKIGSISRGMPVTVNKVQGNWAYVTIKAWVWRPSLSKTKPKQIFELLVKDVDGSFGKNKFIIKGVLLNQTKIPFAKVVLQGELFKGKKRVAYKTLTLFSKKKPLWAGKRAPFSFAFKRTTGFDSYSVRILSALEK
jgi:hypothetical protein